MESIERLRKMDDEMLVPLGNGQYVPDHSHNDIADDIEREIAERYMELPVDADGVPIHMDDMLKSENASKPFIVESMTFADSWTVWDRENGATRWPSECHHIKPRTIEDVLRDCCNEWNEHCGNDWEQSVYAKYADEIRRVL